MTTRRLEFKIAVIRKGLTMYGAAERLGVSYQHLVLVLDGKRIGSQRLEAGIARVMK